MTAFKNWVMSLMGRHVESAVFKSPQHRAVEQDVARSQQEREQILQKQEIAREAIHQLLKAQVLVILRDRDQNATSSH